MVASLLHYMTQRLRRLWEKVVANPWTFASVVALVAALVLAPLLALDSGFTFDEDVQREYGELILAWYRSQFVERGALDFRNLYLYGGLFDLLSQWIISNNWSPWGPFETRHVITALIAVLGLIPTWLAASRIAGPRAGFLAALLLALTPIWVGHGMFNPKDIPFATASAFVAYASVEIALTPAPLRWRHALYAGVSFGAALGVRPGGMFLAAFILLAAFGRLALDAKEAQDRSARASTLKALVVLGRLACMLPIVWALMLSAWPWAQIAPFERPFEAASIAAHFDWGGHMRFNGRTISTDDLPLSYLPVWFAVTLPDTYFLALLCGIICLCFVRGVGWLWRPQTLALITLSAFVIVPYLGVLLKRPIVYDAQRHFLFTVPPMAALAGIALSKAAQHARLPRAVRLAGTGFWALLTLIVAFDMWRVHPYEYLYFNRLYGGLAAANGNFETDYWGASYREGFAWVVENVKPKSKKKPIKVAVCNQSPGGWQLNYLRKQWGLEQKYVLVKSEQKAHEIYLGFIRGDCHKRDGEVLHVVERMGVPLLYVLRR